MLSAPARQAVCSDCRAGVALNSPLFLTLLALLYGDVWLLTPRSPIEHFDSVRVGTEPPGQLLVVPRSGSPAHPVDPPQASTVEAPPSASREGAIRSPVETQPQRDRSRGAPTPWRPLLPEEIMGRMQYLYKWEPEESRDHYKVAIHGYLIAPYGGQHYKRRSDMVAEALRQRCAAVLAGSTLPHYITVVDVPPAEIKLMRDIGILVVDRSHEVELVKSWWKPVFDEETARQLGRMWVDGNSDGTGRRDGWTTLFKFFAWNETGYDRVFVVDMDVVFIGDPGQQLQKLARSPAGLHVEGQQAKRKYVGITVHAMLLRPSQRVFAELVQKSVAGDYVPYTNGEQDILEWYFRNGPGEGGGMRAQLHEDFSQETSNRHHAHGPFCRTRDLVRQFADEALTCQIVHARCQQRGR
mmetsp:Transcript_17075/g.50899  ORF Transcript_17075/g.50899 Transcript_17075/m.50899 type:complete len:411 (-) Transcript_17075:21-1253(-)